MLLSVGFGIAVGTLVGNDLIVWGAIAIAAIWVFLVLRSARALPQVREGWAALQAGHPDLAAERAREVLASQTLLGSAIVTAVAVLAGASRERQPVDAAQLAGFALSRRERLLVGDRVNLQIIMAEALLAIGSVEGTRAAMHSLYTTRLSLPDALRLLLLQLRTEARLGASASMVDRLAQKVDMADLMPPPDVALAMALLCQAASRSGLSDWAAWLDRRVALLADWSELKRRESVLNGLQEPAVSSAPV
jgi:hypothetical protein